LSDQSTSNRKFGLVLAGGFLALTALAYWRKHTISPTLLSVAGVAAALALLYPPLLGPVQRLWMKVGAVLGYVNARLILSIVFFIIITPIALLMRVFRRRPINPSTSATADSYWHRREGSSTEMERQF